MIFGMTKSGSGLRVTRDRFPVFTYYVSFFSSQDAKRIADVRTLKELGYDGIITPCDAADTGLFAVLADLGMGLMIEYNGDPKSSILAAADAYGIVVGHISGDDVDLSFDDAEDFAATEAEYQALDTNKLTLCSLANGNTKSAEFAGASDMLGVQCYPVTAETMEAMEYQYVNARTACTSANVPFIAHNQTSRWSGDRMPTPKEFLMMAWGSICFGCDGHFTYAAYDCNPNGGNPITITDIFANDLPMQRFRATIKGFIADVRRYEHYILRGTRSANYNSGGITATWTDTVTGRKLTVAINYSAETIIIREENI